MCAELFIYLFIFVPGNTAHGSYTQTQENTQAEVYTNSYIQTPTLGKRQTEP